MGEALEYMRGGFGGYINLYHILYNILSVPIRNVIGTTTNHKKNLVSSNKRQIIIDRIDIILSIRGKK